MIWPGKRIADDANMRKNVVWQPLPPSGALSEGGMLGTWGVDMYPEAVMEMVRAMQKVFGPPGRVLLAHEGGSVAALVCDALSLGWRALGATVVAAGVAPLLLIREALMRGEAQWGMVVRALGDEVNVRVVDKNGICLGRKAFRKIAQNANDMASSAALHPGLREIATLSMEAVVKRLKGTMLPSARDSVFVIGGNGTGADTLIVALKAVGAAVDTMQDPGEMEELVNTGFYSAGFFIDDRDDALSMVTKDGVLNEVQMLDTAIYALALNTGLTRIPLFLDARRTSRDGLMKGASRRCASAGRRPTRGPCSKERDQAQTAMLVLTEPCAPRAPLRADVHGRPRLAGRACAADGDALHGNARGRLRPREAGHAIKELSAAADPGDRLLVEGVRVRHGDGFASYSARVARAVQDRLPREQRGVRLRAGRFLRRRGQSHTRPDADAGED